MFIAKHLKLSEHWTCGSLLDAPDKVVRIFLYHFPEGPSSMKYEPKKAFAARANVKEVGLDSCVSYRDRSRGEMRSFGNAGCPTLCFELLSSVFYR